MSELALSTSLSFRRLKAEDLFALKPQQSQATWLGERTASLTPEQAENHAEGPNSWTAWRDGKVLACFGVMDVAPDRHGAGWALLGSGLRRAHLPLTRFVRDVVIGQCPLARIDTFAPCASPGSLSPDGYLRDSPPLHTGSQIELVSYALQHPTAEVRWALAIGFLPLCVMRKYGPAGETIMQLERVS